jgi:hypothetical protein
MFLLRLEQLWKFLDFSFMSPWGFPQQLHAEWHSVFPKEIREEQSQSAILPHAAAMIEKLQLSQLDRRGLVGKKPCLD